MYTLGLGEHQTHILDLDRSIFHEVVLQIFPVMIRHWTVFCNKKYKYCSKKSIASEKMERAKIKHRQINAKRQRQKIRLLKKHGSKGASQYNTPVNSAVLLNDFSNNNGIEVGGMGDSPRNSNNKHFLKSKTTTTSDNNDNTNVKNKNNNNKTGKRRNSIQKVEESCFIEQVTLKFSIGDGLTLVKPMTYGNSQNKTEEIT